MKILFQFQEKDLNNFFIEALLVITIFSFIIQYIINTFSIKKMSLELYFFMEIKIIIMSFV